MKALRTPDECFDSLPGYDFQPHYVHVAAGDGSIDALRVHYLDEGPLEAASVDAGSSAADRAGPAEVVLLLHGEPSWSYLYRRMVPPLVAAGLRVITPDLVGFGRSDKPASRSDYTYARHVEWMREALFDQLGLQGITFFGQDWGGLVGLRLVAEHPERFRRVAVANTGLPTGDVQLSEAFFVWQRFSQEAPELPVGTVVASGCANRPSEEVIAAYDGARSPTSRTRRVHASSPSSSRPNPMTLLPRRTVERGRCWARSTSRFSALSATATPSPREPTSSSRSSSPGHALKAISRSPTRATSSRRTSPKTWPLP